MLLQPLLSAEVGLRRGLGLFALASVGLGLPVVVVPGIGNTAGSAHLGILRMEVVEEKKRKIENGGSNRGRFDVYIKLSLVSCCYHRALVEKKQPSQGNSNVRCRCRLYFWQSLRQPARSFCRSMNVRIDGRWLKKSVLLGISERAGHSARMGYKVRFVCV